MKGLRVVLVALATLAVTACGVPSIADLPLPGGAPGGPSYEVTVEFADVLDLVPHSTVKVNDVTVGEVESIGLSGWVARVRVRIATTVVLPDNALAAIRQTSLLGEKFVSLAAPTTEPTVGTLNDGDLIPLARTRRAVEVEEVLAAFGALLNGGSLTNLETIAHELSVALDGNVEPAKDLLHQVDTFVAGLDARKVEIGQAIDALDRLLSKASDQRETIGQALDAIGPGVGVLAEQRAQLTTALTALGNLGTVGTRVITGSRDELLSVLADLTPVLDQLNQAGANLPKALDSLFTIIFPPNITDSIKNGYINLHADVANGFGRPGVAGNPSIGVHGGLTTLLERGTKP